MTENHTLPRLSHRCQAAMPCGTRSHQFAGESATFTLALPAAPLAAGGLAPQHPGLCACGGGDAGALVPLQAQMPARPSPVCRLPAPGWTGMALPCRGLSCGVG